MKLHISTYLFEAPEGCLAIQTITKKNGEYVSWSLGSCTSSTYEYNRFYNDVCCMPDGNYDLTCYYHGNYDEGWNGGYMLIGNNKYCENFTSGVEKKESVHVTASGT